MKEVSPQPQPVYKKKGYNFYLTKQIQPFFVLFCFFQGFGIFLEKCDNCSSELVQLDVYDIPQTMILNIVNNKGII